MLDRHKLVDTLWEYKESLGALSDDRARDALQREYETFRNFQAYARNPDARVYDEWADHKETMGRIAAYDRKNNHASTIYSYIHL